VSHSSTLATQLRAEHLLMPFSKVLLGCERGEERQIPFFVVLSQTPADQFQRWTQIPLRQLIHQLVELFADCAHTPSLSATPLTCRSRRAGGCPKDPEPAGSGVFWLVGAVGRGGVEPPTFRFSVNDTRSGAHLASPAETSRLHDPNPATWARIRHDQGSTATRSAREPTAVCGPVPGRWGSRQRSAARYC
jgi:hypothetical protein